MKNFFDFTSLEEAEVEWSSSDSSSSSRIVCLPRRITFLKPLLTRSSLLNVFLTGLFRSGTLFYIVIFYTEMTSKSFSSIYTTSARSLEEL